MSTRLDPADALGPGATVPARGIARAIWGLVDDAYGLAARTPDLTPREAHDLCREADVGDPASEVEDALTFVHVPRWGYVCARLFTNADRDSSGRAALVSDVVAVDPQAFASLRHDPFRCFPPRQADRRPELRGELRAPALTPMTVEAEAALLGRLLDRADVAVLRPLLGALLEGDRVLWVSAPPAQTALQCLVLLLPVPLRPQLTFQTLAVDRPRHAPRLTCAPRRGAELNEQAWTRELPRQAAQVDARALAAADALIVGAADATALTAAHALYERYTGEVGEAEPGTLLREVERVVGFLELHRGVRRAAPTDAVRSLAADASAGELGILVDVLTDAFPPAMLAAAMAAMLRRPARDGDVDAAATVVTEVARRLRPGDPRLAAFFAPLVRALDGWAPAVTAGAAVQRARVVLAVAAASLADPNALVAWATSDADWDDAAAALGRPVLEGATAPARAPLAALVAARSADADAAAGVVESLGRALPHLSPATRPHAAALALAVVRRAFRERSQTADGGAAAARAADGLLRLWSHEPPDAEGAVFRSLLAPVHGDAAQAGRVTNAVHAAILTGTGGGANAATLGEQELLAWVAVLVSRAAAADDPADPLDQAARLVEHAPRLGRDESARAQQLGRMLLATFPHGAWLTPEWIGFLRHCDAAARRQLLLRALERAAAGQSGGIAAFTEVCAVLADAGVTLDAEAIAYLRPSLQRIIGSLGVSPGAGVRLAGLLGVLGALVDADGTAALVRQLLDRVPNGLQKPFRLRRLAGALAEVEQVRDEDAHAELRELFRDVASGHHVPLPIPPGDEQLLRDFLGMPSAPLGSRMLSAMGLGKRAAPPAAPPAAVQPVATAPVAAPQEDRR